LHTARIERKRLWRNLLAELAARAHNPPTGALSIAAIETVDLRMAE
jgi:hypothetical protein